MMKVKYWVLVLLVVVMGGCIVLYKMESDIDVIIDKIVSLVKEVGCIVLGVVMLFMLLVIYDSGIWLGKNVVKLG